MTDKKPIKSETQNDEQSSTIEEHREADAQPHTPLSADSLSADEAQGRTPTGQFTEGNPGGPGRPPGAPNKVNAMLKEDILQAYNELGGIEWLRSLDTRLFVRLLEKVMPREIAADVKMQGNVEAEIDYSKMSDDELRAVHHMLQLDVFTDAALHHDTDTLKMAKETIDAELHKRETTDQRTGADIVAPD